MDGRAGKLSNSASSSAMRRSRVSSAPGRRPNRSAEEYAAAVTSKAVYVENNYLLGPGLIGLGHQPRSQGCILFDNRAVPQILMWTLARVIDQEQRAFGFSDKFPWVIWRLPL